MRRMEPVRVSTTIRLSALSTICSASLTRHVRSLITTGILNDTHLQLLTSFMTHLEELDARVDLSPITCSVVFPPRLQQLILRLQDTAANVSEVEPARVNQLLQSTGELADLQVLEIQCYNHSTLFFGQQLAPLLECTKLQTFRWGCEHIEAVSEEHYSVWRQLPALTKLSVGGTNLPVKLLEGLLKQPHELQLQELGLESSGLSDSHVQLISGVPSLTRLTYSTLLNVPHLDWLMPLTQLTQLTIKTQHSPEITANVIVTALKPLSVLTKLRIDHAPIQSNDIGVILKQHPKLASLSLEYLAQLSTLQCFETPPSIQSLMLLLCRHSQLNASDLRYLQSQYQPSLHKLAVCKCFQMSTEEIKQWRATGRKLTYNAP